jgi:hypothetical protein
MTVTRTVGQFTLGLALVAATGAASAQPVGLVFEQAIYQDAKEAPLSHPQGVACSDTALWVADTGNGRLLSFTLKDGRLSLGNEVKVTQLTYPTRLELDGKGGLVALDGKTRKLVRLDAKGAFQGTAELKGIANASQVVPGGFKLTPDGLYVLDVAGRRVLVADAAGNVARQLPLPPGGQFTDVAIDLAGTVYVVDAVAAALWSAGKDAKEFAPLVKNMKDKMSFPTSMLANRGKIFLVDQHGNGIVTVGLDGSYQGRQLGIGWTDGTVYYPSQLCLTEGGAAFVADRYNNRVQYFSMSR